MRLVNIVILYEKKSQGLDFKARRKSHPLIATSNGIYASTLFMTKAIYKKSHIDISKAELSGCS